MLPEVDLARLQSLAGHAFERGEQYWREGRVRGYVVDGTRIRGTVQGNNAYEVVVSLDGARVVTACSCPMGTLCKHAVALLLHHTHEAQPHAAAGPPETFPTQRDVDAFVREHHVEHALRWSAAVLAPRLPIATNDYWRSNVLPGLAVRDLACFARAKGYGQTRGLDLALAQAAHAFLHEAADEVRRGLAEERERAAEPADPALLPLWRKLQALRDEVRERAVPRPRAARAACRWTLDPATLVVEWREVARISHPHGYGNLACVARLGFPDGHTAALECACGASRGRCTHGLALIDAVLDALGDPAGVDAARELAGQLLRPRWARALAALDDFEARLAAAATSELWWELWQTDRGLPRVDGLLRKQTKKGALSKGARTGGATLIEQHRDRLDERDLAIATSIADDDAFDSYPARAFARLVGHPRVVFRGHEQPAEIVAGRLGFNALAHGDAIRLEPAVDGLRLSPRLLDALLDAHTENPLVLLEPEANRCLVIDAGPDARQLWTVLRTHGDTFPPESHAPLVERLARLETKLPLALPRELKGRQLAAEPTVVLRLRLLPDVSLETEVFVRPGPGAPLFPPGTGPRDVLLLQGGERGYVRRDLDLEVQLAERALEQLPMATAEQGPPGCFRLDEPNLALALVAALQDPPRGVEAEWIDDRAYVRRASGFEGLRVKVEQKRDWFGIVGDLKVEDGRVELALVLDAARRQQRFVRVDANRWVELTQQLSQQLLALADQTFASKDRLELSPGAVPAIKALAEAGAKVEVAADWQRLTERLVASRTLRPKPPAGLRGTLRDYQVEGHAWLTRVAAWGAGACLADDMGLGKTIQAIAVLVDRSKHGPALVLAPTSVTLNWVDELARFAPGLRPRVYADAPDRAALLASLTKKDVLIASYGLLVRDVEQLAATRFATLVLDEAQAIKNPTTQRARAARRLQADFRVGLSGTPFENHLGELWSLFSVIFPGLLGSWEQFRERFATPIEKYKDPDARAALSRVLRPFMLRRTKAEVARELPPRTEIDIPIALSDGERELYEDARLAAIAELTAKQAGTLDQHRRFQVLAALTRLRLLACHPRLYDPKSKLPSAKLERAVELLEELRAEGHRALVFSQFTSHLALVRDALVAAGFSLLYLDGATPAAQRKSLVSRFQTGEGDAFLISLKAGGQGINLTAADYILHLDPWWNPAVEDQATDRAHRIGQDKPVTVYRLIARDTIEDRIRALHDDKRALVAGILEGTDVAARLTTKDLMALLQQR